MQSYNRIILGEKKDKKPNNNNFNELLYENMYFYKRKV